MVKTLYLKTFTYKNTADNVTKRIKTNKETYEKVTFNTRSCGCT